MSLTTESEGLPCSNSEDGIVNNLLSRIKKYGIIRAAEKPIIARFTQEDIKGEDWTQIATEVVAFVTSVVEKEYPIPSQELLNWIPNNKWTIIANRFGVHSATSAVAITSGRYVSISGVESVFDLQEDKIIKNIPMDWIESRVFNIVRIISIKSTTKV